MGIPFEDEILNKNMKSQRQRKQRDEKFSDWGYAKYRKSVENRNKEIEQRAKKLMPPDKACGFQDKEQYSEKCGNKGRPKLCFAPAEQKNQKQHTGKQGQHNLAEQNKHIIHVPMNAPEQAKGKRNHKKGCHSENQRTIRFDEITRFHKKHLNGIILQFEKEFNT